MDTVQHMERVEQPGTDISFKLSFRKARERTPSTRTDFDDVHIALIDNRCTGDKVSVSRARGKVSPAAEKFFEALEAATNKANPMSADFSSYGYNPATLEQWREECLKRGLIEDGSKRAEHSARTLFARYKSELIVANWITCNETTAWISLCP